MLRLFHHYYSGRKLAFFTAETAAIAVAGLVGAFAVASAFAPPESQIQLPLLWPALLLVSFALVCSFQFALYILDLYDLRVAVEDRRIGTRMLKAAGVAAVALGGLTALLPVSLPTGAVLG
ncbi:MAG: sugar transferase, partial [Myxococcota bacterium]|nr:sugar transferase [Myxococcota bacterium]